MSQTTKNRSNLEKVVYAVILGIVVLVLLTPAFIGFAAGDNAIEANKLGCKVLESGLQQVNPMPRANPQTAEQCIEAQEMTRGFFRFVFSGIAYIASAMLVVVLFIFIPKKKQPTTQTA